MIFNHLLSLVFAGFWFKLLSTLASALILTEKFDFYNLDKNGIDFSETVANIG